MLFTSCGSNADDSKVKVGDVYYSDGTTAHVDSRNKSKDNQVAGFVVSVKKDKPAVIMCRKVKEEGRTNWRYYMTNKTRKDCFPSQHVFDSNGNELSKTDVNGKDSYSQYLSQEDSVKNTCVYYRWIDSLNNPEDTNYIALPDGAEWYIPTMFELKAAKDKKGNYPYLKSLENFQKGKNDSEINELCGKKISLERQDENYYSVFYVLQSSTLRLSPSGNDPEGTQLLELLAYIDEPYPRYGNIYDRKWTDDLIAIDDPVDVLWVAFAEVN